MTDIKVGDWVRLKPEEQTEWVVKDDAMQVVAVRELAGYETLIVSYHGRTEHQWSFMPSFLDVVHPPLDEQFPPGEHPEDQPEPKGDGNPFAWTPQDAVLQRAKTLIKGQRRQDYGTAEESFGRIARLWSEVLGAEVTPVQVTQCLAMLKMSRMIQTGDHADSYVDAIGYLALCAQLADVKVEGLS